MKPRLKSAAATLTMLCLVLPYQAQSAVPDLTKGGKLTRINERWAGPIGIHCGIWRPKSGDKNEDIRQLQVLAVDKGSPADGVLQVDDVILGADGTGAATVPLFQGSKIWPMVPIAEAITEAEARDPALLKLLIWRPATSGKAAPTVKQPSLDDLDNLGEDLDLSNSDPKVHSPPPPKGDNAKTGSSTMTVTIKLESLGRYSDTAPYNCPKSKAILRKGIKALYEENKFDSSGLGVICLLAADDPTNPDSAKYQARAKEWAHKLEVGGSPWFSGPKLMALSEYYMKTKDETIFPKLVAQAEHHAIGVSWFGTAGHKWCDKQPDGSNNGRLSGYGPITASGALGYLGLSLAREAGVKSPAVEKSHEAQRKFFGHYAFRSAMNYGEMPYGIGGGDGDSCAKQSNSGLAIGMDEGREEKAKYFTRAATLSSMASRQYNHGGSFFGQVFHPLGAVQGGEKAANMQFKEIRWHLDLKRRWDHTRIYDGINDTRYTESFHAGATALIFYAAPLKQIYLTGKGQSDSLKFTDAEFEDIVATKNFDASKASVNELVAVLPRFQGMHRWTAGQELADRVNAKPDAPEWPALIDQLITLAADESNTTHGRTGACCALMLIKGSSKDPVVKSMKDAEIAKTMSGLLKNPEAYIRFAGVRVLQKLDTKAVQPYANEIMDAIIATGRPTFPLDEEDPLQWAHGEMGVLLYDSVLSKGLDGVDRSKLIPAIRSLLQTPNSSARNTSTNVLPMLDKEETLAVADLIVDNIQVAPPANAMGGALAIENSQAALANFLFEEALPLSAVYGVAAAIKNKIPDKYGKAALNTDSAEQFMQAIGDQILIEAVDARGAAVAIEKSEGSGKLLKLKRIHGIKAEKENLKLPEAQTKLTVDATNYAVRGENDTIYTWRKISGTGKVNFTPNESAQSKTTTVTFTDKKPGNYRFEVTMSDTLGFNVVRETVEVSLYDPSGKLPSNQPPQAKSQSHEVAPGQPVPVTLSGADPDGDDLGFVVTQQPTHGRLSGDGADLTYIANFGFEGTDQLTFNAIDGQGKTATGTVELKVSNKDVGVAIYEGFNYPTGPLHGREGGTSFGFAGPWQGSKGPGSKYKVHLGSLDKPGENPSMSYPCLPTTGGRLTGEGDSVSRYLDPKVLSAHKLLDPGQELWFSIFINQPGLTFELKGPQVGLGFTLDGHKSTIDATLNGNKAGTSRNPWSRSAGLRFSQTAPHMIVGRCVWGKTEKDTDTLEIYRVFDAPRFGPVLVKEPVCVLEELIAQETLNSVYLGIGANAAADEIRIGPTLHSVMAGTKPLR